MWSWLCLLEFPLRVCVLTSQAQAAMWRRNGFALLNQVTKQQHKQRSTNNPTQSNLIHSTVGFFGAVQGASK